MTELDLKKAMELLQQIEVQNAPHSPSAAQALTTPSGSAFERLYRAKPQNELGWHSIGPQDHRRVRFNGIDLVGYAPYRSEWKGTGPYKIYAPYGWAAKKPAAGKYATEKDAEKAALEWFGEWLENVSDNTEIVWSKESSDRHFFARVKGFYIGHYYYSAKETKDWHKGLSAYFGDTYYTCDFAEPEEAKVAITETWREWLTLAKRHILSLNAERRGSQ